MGRTGWNGNDIIDKMYPKMFESAGLLRNGNIMAHPQMLTPTQEYNTYVVIIIIVSSLFGVWGKMRLYTFTCTPTPRGHINLLVVAYSISGDSLCWWQRRRQNGKLVQIARNCNAQRINDKTNLKPIPLIHTQEIPKSSKLLYACYFWSLCICLVEFLWA